VYYNDKRPILHNILFSYILSYFSAETGIQAKKTYNNAFILSPFSKILVVQDNLNKSTRKQFGFNFKEQVLLQSYKFFLKKHYSYG
jgi:hypothetical protein